VLKLRKTEKINSGSSWKFIKGNAAIFSLSIAVLGVLSLVLPKPTFSEVEKRDLAARPALTAQAVFSASYMKDFTAWFADTFPGREELISLGHLIEDFRGIRPNAIKVYNMAPAAPPADEPSPEPTPAAPEQVTPPVPSADPQPAPLPEAETPATPESDHIVVQPYSDDADVRYLMDNGIFVFDDRSVNLFGGSRANAEHYAQVINGYLDEIDPSVQVYNLVAPCSSEFYLPARYRQNSGDQWENIEIIYNALDSRVKSIDAYNALAAHADEYIYFRTDHHWTALGAYYAYQAFCRQAGFSPVALEEMEMRTREGFLGTFYTQTGDQVLQQNPDTLHYYIPNVEYENWICMKDQPYTLTKLNGIFGEMASAVNSYSIFLYGDYPLEKIVTENQTGRKIVVVKESYGNAFAPFLLAHYDEIYIVDQRYYQTSLLDLMEEQGITDLLFINNIFAANTPYHINCIDRLKHQVWADPEPAPESDGEEE